MAVRGPAVNLRPISNTAATRCGPFLSRPGRTLQAGAQGLLASSNACPAPHPSVTHLTIPVRHPVVVFLCIRVRITSALLLGRLPSAASESEFNFTSDSQRTHRRSQRLVRAVQATSPARGRAYEPSAFRAHARAVSNPT